MLNLKSILTLLLVGLGLSGLNGQTRPVYFSDYPCLSPDGATIVFAFEGDLWSVSSDGGTARRITAMEGIESRPAISPDGQWLAFTATPYGNADIFVMPLEGGEIQQLTYHEAGDELSSWEWDSETLYFTSSRENRMTTYTVSRDGETPRRLYPHYFNTVHNVVTHPQTGAVYFNESWESSTFTHRKGYKGAFNPDIKSYDPNSGTYTEHTEYEGKDFAPTIDRNGQLYFLSDEHNGEYNIYTFDEGGTKKRLTGFDTSVRRLQVSANGNHIVFQKDYQIFIFDTASGNSRKVGIQVVRNDDLTKAKDFEVQGNITAFAPSGDGNKLAFVSRGELFVSDVEGKFVRQIPTAADGRVSEVNWMADDRTLLFNQTVGGYQNWFTVDAQGKDPARALTDDRQNNRQLTFNSDKTKAVYLSGREELRLLDAETLESTTLLREELWGFYNDTPLFGPDDQHILFTAHRDFEKDILVYDLETERLRNLTESAVTETNPRWSGDGKYLYFISNRTEPSYPYGLQDSRIYRMPLQAYDSPYRSEKFEELFAEEEKEEEKENGEEADGEDDEEEAEKTEITIDEEDLMLRLEQIGPRFGRQLGPYVIQEEEKTTLLYASNHDKGQYALWKTTMAPFEDEKTEKIEGVNGVGYDIQKGEEDYFVLAGGNLHKLNLAGNKAEKIDINYTFSRRLRAEFEQMFEETWANMEENFYNETFHGRDWPAIRDRYAEFLPYLNNRNDLRRLLNDMLGELNTSHFGFYSNGKEESTYYGFRTQATGILFADDDPYRVQRIVRHSPADKVGIDLQPGDRLVAVGGQTVDPEQNRESYFAHPNRQEELLLTFERDGEPHRVRLHPASYSSIRSNLYDEWEEACQQRVDEQSEKRVAYVHMKNMGGGSLDRFMREMVSEGRRRDALILDLRYNTGGNVHDKVLRFLAQEPYLQWKYRGGELSNQSNFGPAAKPIVLLINEQSLSDAEMTAAGFKELELGTILGTETYRWIIFTSGKGLVDGSFYRLPSWGCYTLDGQNLERTGVSPDIYVDNNFKHRLEGADPQLDRAIQLVLEQLN